VNFKSLIFPSLQSRALLAVAALAMLAACSSTPDRPKAADIKPGAALLSVHQVWSSQIGEVGFALQPAVNDNAITLASSNGTVASVNAKTGQDFWRTDVGTPISAGVGSDGKLSAVVTRANELVTLDNGKVLWRQRLRAQVFTAPLVAGGRVFLLAADRSISAYDGTTGRKLWTQSRPGEALILRHSGVMLPVGDTLVVGLSGRLAGLNPLNGSVRWEAAIATPRGTNDVERLVDLVGPAARNGALVCARAFQAAVGCVNTARGQSVWSKQANGAEGLQGDETLVFGTESDGRVAAWLQSNGERSWTSDRLQYRALSAPLVIGRSIAIGDGTGLVHLLARADGSVLASLTTDGSAVSTTPALVGQTMVVVTRKGGIFGFQPD
jgi:outer membrane assembly lipoprotein YfgL